MFVIFLSLPGSWRCIGPFCGYNWRFQSADTMPFYTWLKDSPGMSCPVDFTPLVCKDCPTVPSPTTWFFELLLQKGKALSKDCCFKRNSNDSLLQPKKNNLYQKNLLATVSVSFKCLFGNVIFANLVTFVKFEI